ncbi:MAG: L,D-transpeptidase family protein [Pseudobdellovibrionaceae bacterium]
MKKTILIASMTGLALVTATSSLKVFAQASSAAATVRSEDKSSVAVGRVYYVTTFKLNLRNTKSLSSDSVIGALTTNDQVEIVDPLDSSTPLVRVKVLNSASYSGNHEELYVSSEFLSEAPFTQVKTETGSRYFVIQNVATERTRIYERCTSSPDCPHRLIMETEMVVGRPEGPRNDQTRFLTWLGRYRITDWIKFYQDGEAHYPSWYDPRFPQLPPPGANPLKWFDKGLLPNKETGTLRGAFGWFAGLMGPNSNSQWIHGTIGWGADGDKFIQYTRKTWVNMFGNPRSSGCTRLENGAIALTHHLLPVGTEIVRVYAIEGLRDTSLSRYLLQREKKPWEFILTTESVRKSNSATSDRGAVLARGVPESSYLEEGTFHIDQWPDVTPLKRNASWKERIKGNSGNSYGIDESEFQGVFLVDEGRFNGYKHPSSLKVGGMSNRSLPEFLTTSKGGTVPVALDVGPSDGDLEGK